jgi:ABC-type dipeptide/oligopeptide/nickel transport system permease subunit
VNTTTMQHVPLVPWWLAMPVGAVVLVVLARYLVALGGAEMEPKRRRIRTANTVLMMLVTPLVAYGFGVATPARSRAYVFVWVLICSLLFMIIMLALLDMLNSLRLHRDHVRHMRRSMTAQAIVEAARGAGAESGDGP